MPLHGRDHALAADTRGRAQTRDARTGTDGVMSKPTEGSPERRSPGSVAFLRAAWHIALPPSQKSVLIALADLVDVRSRLAWPNIETLVRMTGWSERTVQEALQKLSEASLIKSQGKTYGGRGRATQWELLFEPWTGKGAAAAPFPAGNPAGAAGFSAPDENPAGAAPFSTESGEKRVQQTPLNPAGGALNPAGGAPPHLPTKTQDPPRARERAREGHVESAAPTDGTSEPPLSVGGREFLLSQIATGAALPPPYRHLEPELRDELARRQGAKYGGPNPGSE